MNVEVKFDPTSLCEEEINLPYSKSVALRAEILARIFSEDILLCYNPNCDDTAYLSTALSRLEAGCGMNEEFVYDLGSGAAPFRFFLAYASSVPSFRGVITCSEQLKKRPLAPLVEALRKAGAEIEYLETEGYPPVRVRGGNLLWTSGSFGSDISSQFTSALMMASLVWDKPYEEPVGQDIVSRPYVEMTRKMIDRFRCWSQDSNRIQHIYNVEKDWSAASYFYELVLAAPEISIIIDGLPNPVDSVQGDCACARIFETLGVKTEFLPDGKIRLSADTGIISRLSGRKEPMLFNMRETPDLVPALTVGACLAGIRFVIEGIGHLRHKESDRLAALTRQLAKAGYELINKDESLAWLGKRLALENVLVFDSYGDHRIAMSMSIAAVKLGDIIVEDAGCVSKSFPDFFEQLEKAGFIVKVSV